MTNYSYRSGPTMSEGIMRTIKNNPEGLLLLAAGCALLMRSGSSLGSSLFGGVSTAGRDHQQRHHYSGQGNERSMMGGVADAAAESADRARQYVADVGSSVSETAKGYASSIGNYAEDAQRRVADQSERLMEQARSTMQGTVSRVLQEQPLSLVLLGLAAGAAVASVLPRTSIERQTLGAVGEQLAEVASNVRENLGEAASQAGEKLKQVAEEHGLNAEGLKEAAGEVANAFGSAFKSEDQDTGGPESRDKRAGSPQTASSPSTTAGSSGQHSTGQRTGQGSTAPSIRPAGSSTSTGAGGSSTISGSSSGARPSGSPSNPQSPSGSGGSKRS